MIAFILFGKFIAEPLNIHSERVRNHVACPRIVVLSVVPRPRVGSSMRQLLVETELLRHKGPVVVEPFEFSNEIGEHISVGIDKPIQLVAVRGRMNASGAAVLDPIDEVFEGHFASELQRFRALIERNDTVPWVANKTEFEVGLELLPADFSPALLRKQ